MKDGEINIDMVRYGEYVSSRNWENMVKEVEFQYGVLNLMINEIPVYLAIK